MTARAPEDFDSQEPAERRKKGEGLSSQELLDKLMEGPRMWADTFDALVSERYPTGGRDLQSADKEMKASKKIDATLREYREEWQAPHLTKTIKDHQEIVSTALEPLTSESELSFHLMSRLLVPQWYRILVATKNQKTETFRHGTVQIRLAIESARLIDAKNNSLQPELFDASLRDIDGMITLLQLVIDGQLHDMPDALVVPHPQIGRQNRPADFIIFDREHNGSYSKIDVKSESVLDPSLVPGSVAVGVLKNKVHFPAITNDADFRDKSRLGEVMLARSRVRNFNEETSQPAMLVEDSTRRIGAWLVNRLDETPPSQQETE